MEADIIITIALTIGFVMVVGHLTRVVRTLMFQRTIREAIRVDSQATPALLDRIEERRPAAIGDDRVGLVLLALGLALFCYGLIQGDPDDVRNLAGIALFPVFVGAALLARLWYLKRQGADR